MSFSSITKASRTFVLAAGFLAGCNSGPKRLPVLGEAYVGPATVQLRSDTTPKSAPVATVKHGDRLAILQQKRRVVLVRTAGGAEGWADERQLLAEADMAALKELSERSARMPVQGQATAYADLRVHTQPSYLAPSFLVLKANDKFDVLVHAVVPRMDAERAPLIPPPPKKSKTDRKSSPKNSKLPPPPMPTMPGPPPNWLDLSKSTLPQQEPSPSDAHAEKPVPSDRWSLIRTPSGETGWVYTRLIAMAIPDEVAQYAEGHRIVAYFPLGSVQDGKQIKTTWLWTTVGIGDLPYDFDSFRVFIWSQRHRHYETAHVELHLKGYLPVLVHPVDVSVTGRSKSDLPRGAYPGFSVCMENKDGVRYRREYAMSSERVRFVGEKPCEPPPPRVTVKASVPLPGADVPAPQQPKESLVERIKKHWKALTKRLFGG